MILRGDINDEEAGFLLLRETPCQQPGAHSIVQAAVRFDCQRESVGLSLVEAAERICRQKNGLMLQAACREDLESNLFWRAAGFSLVAFRKGGKARAKRILLWRKSLSFSADLRSIVEPKINLGANGRFVTRKEMGGWNLVDQSAIDAYRFEGLCLRHRAPHDAVGVVGPVAEDQPRNLERAS